MNLPHAKNAWVDPSKVTGYLLAEDHSSGGSKARFFLLNGFTVDRWTELAARLVEHGSANQVSGIRERLGGKLFAVCGAWLCADGRVRTVTTVWMLDDGSEAPRLVTAYPE